MSIISSIRDEVYTRIAVKKAAADFVYSNSFTLERTWKPYELLDKLGTDHPTGKVYIIGGNPIGYGNESRTNLVKAEYSVMVGFQKLINDVNDLAEIDAYTGFMEELEDVCRTEVLPDLFSFTRLEYLRDADGVPFSFVMLRDLFTFEAYFTVYYNRVRAGF